MSLYKIIVLTTLFTFGLIGCNQTIDPKDPYKAANRAIRNYLKKIKANPNARYVAVYKDLNQDGNREVIATIRDLNLCVPEGCPMLVFENTGKKYKFVSQTNKVEFLRGQGKGKNGWKSLVVTTGKEGKEAFILDFNEGYPKEASLGRSFGGRFN